MGFLVRLIVINVSLTFIYCKAIPAPYLFPSESGVVPIYNLSNFLLTKSAKPLSQIYNSSTELDTLADKVPLTYITKVADLLCLRSSSALKVKAPSLKVRRHVPATAYSSAHPVEEVLTITVESSTDVHTDETTTTLTPLQI